MKTKSPEFMSQCRVLNFPWMNKRIRRSKSDCKTVPGQTEYSQILTFQPPSIEFTSDMNDSTFPLIQMMDGKEPFVWEDGQSKSSETFKEATQAKLLCSRTSAKSISKGRIPRPKNAFILYRSHVSQLLKEAMTFKVRESNISSLVSEMWKKEPDVVHAYYAKRAALEWVKYMKRVQQERCAPNTDESEIRPLTPPASLRDESSFSPEPQPNILYTQPSFPSPVQTSIQENSMATSYSDPFIDTMLYNSSLDTSNLEFANIDTSACLSSSPRSSNEDIDFKYKDSILIGNFGYSFADKLSMPLSYKDSTFSLPCNINQFDANCGYSFNSSTPVFPTNTYPCMVDNSLTMDTSIRWPGFMATSTSWPVNMV